jgi:hypothetical protein
MSNRCWQNGQIAAEDLICSKCGQPIVTGQSFDALWFATQDPEIDNWFLPVCLPCAQQLASEEVK